MKTTRIRPPIIAALAGALLTAPAWTRADAASEAAQDKDECVRNLRRVYEAIQAYRLDHKDLPKWLSDLVPDYVASAEALKCPITRRTGKTVDSWLTDPRIPGIYLFEFSDAELGKAEDGAKIRMRDWRRRQMGLIGAGVPMLRCRLHTPVLNLSFGGKIYESQDTWELLFADVVNTLDLMPSRLFGQEADQWALGLSGPRRSLELLQTQLNLADYYNALLTLAWLPKTDQNHSRLDLGDVPQKLQPLAGVTFDVRGVIQLTGRRLREAGALFPEVVQDIPVGLKCHRLHFLHGASGGAPEATPIGFYRLSYADGRTQDLQLIYGKNVRDWCAGSTPQGLDEHTAIAWSSAQGADTCSRALFRTTWEHPLPEVEIKTIDFASNLTASAPFLVAITAEKLDLRFGLRHAQPLSEEAPPVRDLERLSAK
jgi:hypothetical protein